MTMVGPTVGADGKVWIYNLPQDGQVTEEEISIPADRPPTSTDVRNTASVAH